MIKSYTQMCSICVYLYPHQHPHFTTSKIRTYACERSMWADRKLGWAERGAGVARVDSRIVRLVTGSEDKFRNKIKLRVTELVSIRGSHAILW